MFDIHAHLHFKDYDADRDTVIARAKDAGVEKIILIGTDIDSSRGAIMLAEKYDFLYASVGIHPHSFNEIEGEITNTKSQTPNKAQIQNSKFQTEIGGIRELARHPKVVAIGECGLDYFSRDPENPVDGEQKAEQKERFLAQVEIAKEAQLPLIIHTRPSAGTMDAYEDMSSVLQSEIVNLKSVVLHCYQGDTEVTKKFIGLPNVYFSFAGNVTYPVKKMLEGTKDDIRETVKLVPAERLFVETDCPYLSPQEKRGERNEPANVILTAAVVSAIKGIPVGELERQTESSLGEVFGRIV